MFPNCPQYMSKEKPADRPPLSSSAARQETVEKRKEEERLRKVELDAVMSLADNNSKLTSKEYLELEKRSIGKLSFKIYQSQTCFFELDIREILTLHKIQFSYFGGLNFQTMARRNIFIPESNNTHYKIW